MPKEKEEQLKRIDGSYLSKKYDENGNLKYMAEYDKSGHIIASNSYDKGRLTSQTAYYENGKTKAEREFDEKGNIKNELSIERDGSSIAKSYDAQGNVTRDKSIDNEGNRTEKSYDAHGNVTKETFHGNDGTLLDKSYDAQGNVIQEMSLDVEGNLSIKNFDENGNTTSKTLYNNDGSRQEQGIAVSGNEPSAKTAEAKPAENVQQYADELKGLTGADWEFKDAEHSGLKKNNLRVPETPELVAKLKESGIRFGHSVKGDEKYVFVDTNKPLHLTQEEIFERKAQEVGNPHKLHVQPRLSKEQEAKAKKEADKYFEEKRQKEAAENEPAKKETKPIEKEGAEKEARKDNMIETVDENGITHLVEKSENGTILAEATYDKDGKPITDHTYNEDGKPLSEKFYENGNIVKETVYDYKDGELTGRVETLHGKDGSQKTTVIEEKKNEAEENSAVDDGKTEETPSFGMGGALLPDNENEGKEEATEDLEGQMWALSWKNKFLGIEHDNNKDERNNAFPFARCLPDTIRTENDPPPPRVSMTLEGGSKLTNSSKGINLEYNGEPKDSDFLAMVQLGREKGWKSARIDPEASPEFQANMYKAMLAMGMNVSNAAEIEKMLGQEAVAQLKQEALKMAKENNLAGKCDDMDARYPQLDAERQKLQEGMNPEKAFKRFKDEDYKKINEALAEQEAEQTKTVDSKTDGKEEEKPKDKEEPAKEEKPKDKEEPAKEEKPKDKEEPAKEEKPKDKEEPAKEEKPKDKEEPAKEEKPKDKEEPAKEEKPKDKEEPVKVAAAKTEGKEAAAATKPSLSQEINGFVKETETQLQGRKAKPLTEKQLATVDKMVAEMVEKHPDVAKDLQKKLGNGRFTPSMTLKMISNANVEIAKREAEGKTGPDMSKRQTKQPNVANLQNLVKNKLGAERK